MQEKTVKKGIVRAVASVLVILTLLMTFPVAASAYREAEASNRVSGYEGVKLCPGGIPFGIKMYTDGVMVVGITGIMSGGKSTAPASDAGVKPGDVIKVIDGITIDSIERVTQLVENGGGRAVTLTVIRNGEEKKLSLTPSLCDSDGKYKAGMWLRDSTAGIGTVTYIDPETLSYGGLGHGICDIDTAKLMPLKRGSAMGVEIGGVVKGQKGVPGELKGYFIPERLGNVLSNTECGVFGVFSSMPKGASEAIPIGTRKEIHDGEAEIICTVGNDLARRYKINISEINRNGTDNRNFVITVTDDKLISQTGGIVQGMSGSPIIQDGKLVGAVTHVLVADSSKGYGILIENMLDTAKNAEQTKQSR